ncbi:MAG: putative Se/S carrier-like protein [Candidatus Cloacimonadota bacterium]|nr:putative Se/S carrier-like protein [Candidatus Cloacimonadota bacterium]
MELIITFKNSHAAIKCKKRTISKFSTLQLIPTPRDISSECGFTILLLNVEISDFVKEMHNKNLDFENIYIKEDNKFTKMR